MEKKKRWILTFLLIFGTIAILGLTTSAFMFRGWSDLTTVTQDEADRKFLATKSRIGGRPSLIHIGDGRVQMRQELLGPQPSEIRSLSVLVWEKSKSKLLRTDFPFWFVRLKMNDTVNLGTITSALVKDWDNLNLKISVEELERFGPGVVLDHRMKNESRILLWTEAPETPAP